MEAKPGRFRADKGFVNPTDLPKGPNGRPLCRYCSQETSPPRKTFCTDLCIHEFKIRSQPSYARKEVFKRDKGVCQACALDTEKLKELLFRVLNEKGQARYDLLTRNYLAFYGFGFRLDDHYWEADHIKPVEWGGGSCGLENYQTLCRPCHNKKTLNQVKANHANAGWNPR
jgi:5-methylcytosine-specific restriction endonuclease McrA